MAPTDPFEPKLGKIRAQRPKLPKSFRGRILHAAKRAGGLKSRSEGGQKGKGGTSGFGRGSGVTRVIAAAPARGPRTRRVIVKARFVKLGGKGLQAALAHLRYIQRDGVTRDGQPGQLYGPDNDVADGTDFMARADGDRHQFRFIVAPENSDQYDDLKPLTRKLMDQMETDLSTKLDWVAVDHYNTGHPHTHIVIRGKADDGRDLVIARDYLSEGFRHRAEYQVTLDLGPRSDLEIMTERQAEVSLSRFTSIDRHLLRDADARGCVSGSHPNPQVQALRARRLITLRGFGLAEEEAGQWRLRPDLEATLRQMGKRGDIIKTMHEALKAQELTYAMSDAVIHDTAPVSAPVTGRLLKRGLSDEDGDRHFVLVDGTDGRVHYIDIGEGGRVGQLTADSVLKVSPHVPETKTVDHTIAAVSAQANGRYDIATHLKFDPTASLAFAQTHVRRLEAIRKATGDITRRPDGGFDVGPDFLRTALAYEQRESRRAPVVIEVLSEAPLEAQIRRQGVTWLDRELAGEGGQSFAGAGFGAASRAALQQRLQWLLKEDLAKTLPTGEIVMTSTTLGKLHRREWETAVAALRRDTGLPFSEARPGQPVEGRLRQAITLGNGKFAVVERARDFTLIPWRPVLDRHIGKEVAGTMREGGINWSIGRGKGISIE